MCAVQGSIAGVRGSVSVLLDASLCALCVLVASFDQLLAHPAHLPSQATTVSASGASGTLGARAVPAELAAQLLDHVALLLPAL